MAEQSLKDKTVKGTFWSAADAFLGQGVTFLVGLVLARLLSPDEYGLIGICIIFNTVLNGIVDSGFCNALIRKNNCTDVDYNTMFFTNLVFSIVLYVILFLCAPAISLFFERDELTPLIQVSGSVLIFNALSLTHTTILTKLIDFKTKTKASIVSALISGGIGISMAYMGAGAWSLVGQMVSRQLLYTICLWFFIRWWPKLPVSVESFRYMWGFGWKLLLSGMLNNIWNQLYQVVVGKFYSPATLGQYTRSRDFARIFSENFTTIVQRVSYPVLSHIQDEKERMIEAYRKIIKVTMFATCVCLMMLAAVAEPLIVTIIGPQWREAATYLPYICLSMSFYPLHAINLNMLQIQNRTDIFLVIDIIKKIIAIPPILAGIFISIKCMLICSIFVGMISFFLNSYYTGIKLGYTSWMQLKDVLPDYLISFSICIPVFFLKYIYCSDWFILLIQLFVGAVLGLLVCEKIKLPEYLEVKRIVFSYLSRKNK